MSKPPNSKGVSGYGLSFLIESTSGHGEVSPRLPTDIPGRYIAIQTIGFFPSLSRGELKNIVYILIPG